MATIVKAARPPKPRTADDSPPACRCSAQGGEDCVCPRAACTCLIEALEMTQWECSHNRWTRENTGGA